MLSTLMEFSLRLVTPSDIEPLLDFERDNRQYFEKYVPPRPEAYFTKAGAFEKRMVGLLADQAAGSFLMFVLVTQSGDILGRLNLTRSKNDVAVIGYRIAPKYTGNGLISKALLRVEVIAKQKYGFTKLAAFASPSNPASSKSLLNAGFSEYEDHVLQETLNNAPISLHLFTKEL